MIITTESNLVVVPLHVYKNKNSVSGLVAQAFEVLEDGVTPTIAFVEDPAGPGYDPAEGWSVPTEIIILVDVSHSAMRPGLLDLRMIRESMLDGLQDDVSISVYGFAVRLKRFTGPTRGLATLQRAPELAYASQAGRTRVFESILATVRDAVNRNKNVSRMMVVFPDGLSTSGFDPDWAVRAANHFGIPTYPVVLGHQRIVQGAQRDAPVWRRGRGPNAVFRRQGRGRAQARNPTVGRQRQAQARQQESRPREFADLGPQTGGQSFELKVISRKVIRKLLESLAKLAQTEYVVG